MFMYIQPFGESFLQTGFSGSETAGFGAQPAAGYIYLHCRGLYRRLFRARMVQHLYFDLPD